MVCGFDSLEYMIDFFFLEVVCIVSDFICFDILNFGGGNVKGECEVVEYVGVYF